MTLNTFTRSLVLCFVANSVTTTEAVTIKTSDGAGADSYVQLVNGGDGGNFGAVDTIFTKNAIQGSQTLFRKGYMRFDIPTLPVGTTVDTATLQVTTDGTDSTGITFSIFGLDDGDPGESWGEGTINYANAPANTSIAAENNSLLSNASLLGMISGAVSGTDLTLSNVSLTNFLQNDTDGLVTFIITRDFEDPVFGGPIHEFRTKEFADTLDEFAPTLTFTVVGPVPEPSSLLMLIFGALGLVRSTRRRTRRA